MAKDFGHKLDSFKFRFVRHYESKTGGHTVAMFKVKGETYAFASALFSSAF